MCIKALKLSIYTNTLTDTQAVTHAQENFHFQVRAGHPGQDATTILHLRNGLAFMRPRACDSSVYRGF